MQLSARVGRCDQLEEGQELAMTVAGLAGVSDAAGGHVQSGEQRSRAMADIVVGAPLDTPGRQWPDRLGALQRLDLGLLVHAQHDCVGGRVKVQPDHVADPCVQLWVSGELERLSLPWPEVVLGPDPRHRAMAHLQLCGQQPA
jgi:hypothetical protein